MKQPMQVLTESEIASMRRAGAILRACLDQTASLVKPGITTAELDEAAEAFILARGGRPAFKGYHGYTGTLCTSVNDEIVHGIPGRRELRDGDIVSLDCGVLLDGLYTDACVTVPVGTVEDATLRFLDHVRTTLTDVLTIVKEGTPVGTIAAFIESSLRRGGYAPVQDLTGHGLGSTLHQEPTLPNSGREGTGPALLAGTAIAIEPIASMGKASITQDEDGWTIRSVDGSLTCHFEHTVLVTAEGCDVLA